MLKIKKLNSYESNKIITYKNAVYLIKKLKSKNKKIGLCHGAFDLLHPGHIKHFESAKQLCDVLFISITKDKFVALRKGENRPVYTDKLRAYTVASIQFVDYVVISNFKTGVEVIKILKPNYYIKGPDFINKKTPGIIAERKAIASIGGKIIYTNDPKFSTTELIEHIKNGLDRANLLLILDRDGTLIYNNDFLGKNPYWKQEISLRKEVIKFILFIQSKYNTTKIVVSNQAGVAKGFFSCEVVEEVNKYIGKLLGKKNITINNWQYCPYVDSKYAKLKKSEINFNPKFVVKKTKRKPSPEMIYDGLKTLNKNLEDFSEVIVIGDSHEDKELANNINGSFISVNNKTYDEMVKEFHKFIL